MPCCVFPPGLEVAESDLEGPFRLVLEGGFVVEVVAGGGGDWGAVPG